MHKITIHLTSYSLRLPLPGVVGVSYNFGNYTRNN